jgi:hypothetical protein
VLTWTPQPGQAGSYRVQVIAGGGSSSSSEIVAITATHTNFAPVFVPLLPQYAREGTQVQFTVVEADADGDPLTYTLTNTPAGATLGAASGLFTWTPAYGQAGDTTLHFVATDPGGLIATTDVVVHVAHVVRPPVLNAPNHQATLGMPLSFPIVATDRDAGTTLSYSAVNLTLAPRSTPRPASSSGPPAPLRPATMSSPCKSPTARPHRRKTSSFTRPSGLSRQALPSCSRPASRRFPASRCWSTPSPAASRRLPA